MIRILTCVFAALLAASALFAQTPEEILARMDKETDMAWYFRCVKSKTNKDKDDPKNMDLVVSKATYLPISLKTTLKGVTVTLRDFTVGISEKDVTFDASQYPTAKIIDNR